MAQLPRTIRSPSWHVHETPAVHAGMALAERERHAQLIRQSHERCAALGLVRIGRPEYAPLVHSDLRAAIDRNQRLLTHAAPVMEMLFEQIVDTQSMIVLTDSQGTILHAVGDSDFLGEASKVALAPGVNWSEPAKGTNAIGTALFAEQPTLVHADEHYMHANGFLTCSAAPIFDPRGNILGVLDVTGDHRSYHRHTMGLVRMSVRMIENHWLTEDFRSSLRLHFHSRPEFIGTLLEGIAVVNPEGRFIGANGSALDLLNLHGAALRMRGLSQVFGTTVAALADHFRCAGADPIRLKLPGGRVIYVAARVGWARLHAVHPLAAEAGMALASGDAPAGSTTGPEDLTAWPVLDELPTGDAQGDAAIDKVRRIIDRGIPLLLMGDAGTGKEYLARACHRASRRHAKPFVTLDCAATPQALLEIELLGHDDAGGDPRGHAAAGRLVQAHGGTLFLDEVGELPLPLQARLLRALRERRVVPLGGDVAVAVDVAIVAATRANLRELIDRGEFREDLYYHLNGLAVRLPPLRERSDVLVLAQRILQREAPGRAIELSPEVARLFTRYHWPGNLRQLCGVLHTAVVMAGAQARIEPAHLSDDLLEDMRAEAPAGAAPAVPAALAPNGVPPAPTRPLEEVELEMIRQAVDSTNGNISAASRQLGISRNTIYRKLRWNHS